MRRTIAALIAVGVLLIGATSLFATDPEREAYPDKVQDRVETLTMWKLIEALDLDQPTANKLLEIRHKFLAQRKSLQKGLSQDFKAIRKQLSDPSKTTYETELGRLLADVREKRQELQRLREQQYEDVSKVLTVRQRAQLVLFFKDFRQELRSLIRHPQSPGGVPEKGMLPPNKGMGLHRGAPGIGEKASRPRGLSPVPPEKGMKAAPDPPVPPRHWDVGED